jgi:hypothetical protein
MVKKLRTDQTTLHVFDISEQPHGIVITLRHKFIELLFFPVVALTLCTSRTISLVKTTLAVSGVLSNTVLVEGIHSVVIQYVDRGYIAVLGKGVDFIEYFVVVEEISSSFWGFRRFFVANGGENGRLWHSASENGKDAEDCNANETHEETREYPMCDVRRGSMSVCFKLSRL